MLMDIEYINIWLKEFVNSFLKEYSNNLTVDKKIYLIGINENIQRGYSNMSILMKYGAKGIKNINL